MWTRFGFLFAVCLLAAPAAAGEAGKPPANDDCLACHDTTAKRDDGRSIAVDAKLF